MPNEQAQQLPTGTLRPLTQKTEFGLVCRGDPDPKKLGIFWYSFVPQMLLFALVKKQEATFRTCPGTERCLFSFLACGLLRRWAWILPLCFFGREWLFGRIWILSKERCTDIFPPTVWGDTVHAMVSTRLAI